MWACKHHAVGRAGGHKRGAAGPPQARLDMLARASSAPSSAVEGCN